MPNQDAGLLHILTIVTIINLVIAGPFGVFNNVFSALNKIKTASIVGFLQSIISAFIVIGSLYLIKEENTRMFLIVGVSSVMTMLLHLTFQPVYAAKCLNYEWNTFYSLVFKNMAAFIIFTAVLYIFRIIYKPVFWISFLSVCAAASFAGVIFYYMFVFAKWKERDFIVSN